MKINMWRVATGILLFVAAFGSIASVADASFLGRIAGVFASFALVMIGVNVIRQQNWAYGAAFFMGICWFWAAIALRVQNALSPAEVAFWLVWSVVVMVSSVRSREERPTGAR